MDKILLKQILIDNQREVERRQVFQRDIDLDSFSCYVLIGARRAGKSFLLYQKMQRMLKNGCSWDGMLYLNFEDERLTEFSSSDFNLVLEVFAELSDKRPALFLDELQNIDGWDKFARRLADDKYEVYITGSNAKMLSNEFMSTLGGRYLTKDIYPFSLKEYLDYIKVSYDEKDILSTEARAKLKKAYSEYFHWGGLPECVNLPVKRDYLSSVFQKIYLGDICGRNKISNPGLIRLLIKKTAESVNQPISYNRLSRILSSVSGKISVPTVGSYVRYCEEAWLLLRLHNIAASFSEKETVSKYYFIDNGILNLFLIDGETSLLENLVALTLFRRYGYDPENERVFFYNSNIEVDFYIPDDELAVQVSYRLGKEDRTYEREMGALLKLPSALPCKRRIIITYDQESTIADEQGIIEVIPYWKWSLTT